LLIGVGGYFLRQVWLDWRAQATIRSLETLQLAGKYEECHRFPDPISENSPYYPQFQKLISECQIAQAEKYFQEAQALVRDNDLEEAIQKALLIPDNSILFEDSLRLIDRSSSDLLKQARDEFEEGNWEEAVDLLKAIPPTTYVYTQAQAQAKEWNTEWLDNEKALKTAEEAIKAKQWARVLTAAKKISDNPYWQEHKQTLLLEAQTELAKLATPTPDPTQIPNLTQTTSPTIPDWEQSTRFSPEIRCYNSKGEVYYEGPAWGVSASERSSACR
jgi:tetratricopeptide (TPR) repeat protein